MASFTDDSWTIYEAMVEMFFSGSKKVRDDPGYKENLLKGLKERVQSPYSQAYTSLLPNHRDRIDLIVRHLTGGGMALTEKHPPFKWVRFAYQLSFEIKLPICSQFFHHFGEWRLKTEKENGLIVLEAELSSANRKAGASARKITLDQFILDRSFKDEDEWHIKYLASYISTKIPSKIKDQKQKMAPRGIRATVGPHVFDSALECIEAVACSKVKNLRFNARKDKGRYVFEGTGKELVRELIKYFPNIKGSASSLLPACRHIVACGRYSSKKVFTPD